jgi:hypothetical protein
MTEPSPQPPARRPHRKSSRTLLLAAFMVGVVGGGLLAAFYNPFGKARLDEPAENAPAIDAPFLKSDASQLKRTRITPHLEASIAPGHNVLWCSTFQLVWNESCRAAGGDLHLKNEPPIVPILNKKTASEKDVDAASFLIMSGRLKDGIDSKIRQELARKFNGQASPDLLNNNAAQLPPDGWVAYASLFKSLPFKYRFRRLSEPLPFASENVASFGLRFVGPGMEDERIAGQVAVLDYKSDGDFIVELRPEVGSERIVLAKIAPGKTLQATIETVRTRTASTSLGSWQKQLNEGESLVAPILDFDLLTEYNELCGKPIVTSGPLGGLPVAVAAQSIRFRLDERGAVLKSVAMVGAKAAGPPPSPRKLIFDRPFLILLERRGAAHPYLALWVDNPEVLMPMH